MPELRWQPSELLEFFVAEPTADEYVSYTYDAVAGQFRVVFTVWDHESVVEVSVHRAGAETALFYFSAFVRGEIRRIDDSRGEYLEVEDCLIAPDRFWYLEADNLFDPAIKTSVTIRLTLRPEPHVEFVNFKSRT